ncbi:MAG TPA: hypothetical protein VK809_00570 [Bacteroidia bacterium]|nr:hypothetical protein [Bacteroidia bacterium]
MKDAKSFDDDSEFVHLLAVKVKHITKVASMEDIDGLVPIRKTTTNYRFKIKTNKSTYRVGIKRIKKIIWLACIDNNKKRFYKRFP